MLVISDPNNADPRINNCFTYPKKPQHDYNMASTVLHSSAFRRVNRSRCASNNSSSFSIRNILNLSEEKSQQCAQTLDDVSPSCPVLLYLPQLPQVVWPMAHLYNDDSHCRGLINRQQFRGAQQHHVHRSLADKKMHFIGEWLKLNWQRYRGKVCWSRELPSSSYGSCTVPFFERSLRPQFHHMNM